MKIGLFDSGLGGLSVLKEIDKEIKGIELIFVGDTKRLPYGSKSKDVIIRYSTEIVDFLLSKNVDIIIIACNTATALAYSHLTNNYNVKIYGIIESGVDEIKNKYTKDMENIVVIATSSTVKSKKYKSEINKALKNVFVKEVECPLFVPLIEEGVNNNKLIDECIKNYIDKYKEKMDMLVLGCTHYPFLEKNIKRLYKNTKIINPAKEIARRLKREISLNDLNENKITYYVTSDVYGFKKKAEKFLKKKINDINLIELGE